MANDRQIACPTCYQMNHYNAKRCAYCLGDTWRTDNTPYQEPTTFGTIITFLVLTAGIGLFVGAPAAIVWTGFWAILWVAEKMGLGAGGLCVLGGIMCWLIFF